MNLKYFLVFYKDNGGREDCSVYYSWLVIDKDNKQDAIKKVCDKYDIEEEYLDAEEMNPI